MKTHILKGFGIFAIAVMAIACKKESALNTLSAERPVDKSSVNALLTTVNVHTGGIYNLNGVNNSVVQYWTNTLGPSVLTSNTESHSFRDIETSGTDLYVLATQSLSSSTTFITKYWKNGVLTTLTKPTGSVYAVGQAIAISGTNVYVAGTASYALPTGYYQSRIVLWLNGVVSVLGNSSYNTSATDLVIAGSDIYIPGTRSDLNGQASPGSIYLKNGVQFSLPSSTGGGVSAAVAGSDVYMVCINGSYGASTLAVYKNGAFHNSFTGLPDSYPSAPSIATQGTDVYLSLNGRTLSSGYENNVFVWKNSGPPIMHLISAPYSSNPLTPSYSASNKGLRVSSNGDVYLLGRTTNGNHGYWKNATFYPLPKPSVTYSQGLALMEY